MTTATTPRVFDSAEWAFDAYEAEILGEVSSDEDYDLLRRVAIRMVAREIRLHWSRGGHEVEIVSASEYGRRTWNDEAVNETASSYILPDAEEALDVWRLVAESITPDEVRQFAGLA